MRLTVIGCSGSYPGPESPASCYLLEAEDAERTWRILLDLGSGALGNLQRVLDPLSIDAVFFSHLHADHCLDLTGYYVLRLYHPTGPQPRLTVHGPAGTAGRMARAYDLPEDPGMTGVFDFGEYDGSAIAVGPFTLTPHAVRHPVPAYALRVTDGSRTLVYSGDTAPCPELDEAAAGADLLLAEASFVEGAANPPGLHLTGADVGATATRAGVPRVLLTHVPPWHDPADALRDARTTYTGDVALAAPLETYEL